MFIGAVNQHVRSLLWELSEHWSGPVYVACSGNFTVERILAGRGIAPIHSNDVSIYSCALGRYLAGETMAVDVADPQFNWLNDYLGSMRELVATLMLCTEYFNYIGKPNLYNRRMEAHYRRHFAALHERTLARIDTALDGVTIDSFTAGDLVDYLQRAPKDALAISFPPTYRGGYEQLFKRFDQVFRWDAPSYALFDGDRFAEFERVIQRFDGWVTLTDHPRDELAEHQAAIVQTGLRSRPVHLYMKRPARRRISFPRQHCDHLPRPLHRGPVTEPVDLVELSQRVVNTLRSMFLDPKIIPAAARWNLGVVTEGNLLGVLSFSPPASFGEPDSVYLMSDFAVRPSPHRRLSKLILAAALTHEVKAYLEQWAGRRLATVRTTAFTDKPVSMKYRGLFELEKRGEGFLNYTAELGQWTLTEALEWWTKKHASK